MDMVFLSLALAKLGIEGMTALPHNLPTAGEHPFIEHVVAVPGEEHPSAREG
jgi:hypothetical protein